MASLAESSMGSLQSQELQKLRAAQQRLNNHIQPNIDTQDTSEDTHNSHTHSETATSVEESTSKGSTVPESIEQSIHIPTASPSRASVPILRTSMSAPPAKMQVLIEGERVAISKAQSFSSYPSGDTQPWNSQDLVDSSKSMIGLIQTTPQRSQSVADITPNTLGSTVGPGTDESGRIDLGIDNFSPATSQAGRDFVHTQTQKNRGAELGSTPPPTSQAERDFLRDETQPETQLHAPLPGFPETPAMAGNKHARNGDLLTSATTLSRSPHYTQFFPGDKAPVMTNTQLFGLTDSSPAMGAPPTVSRSDPVMTRPSPNLHSPLARSSPPNFSSPMLHMQHGRSISTASDEPMSHYISMQESQEERQKRLRLAKLVEKGDNFDSDDELMEDTPAVRKRHSLQRNWSNSDLSRIKAPARSKPISRPKSAQGPVAIEIDSDSPATARKRYDRFIDFTAAGQEEQADDEDELANNDIAQADEVDQQGLEKTQDLPEEERDVMYSERDEPHEAGEDDGGEHDAMIIEDEDDNDEYDEFGQTLRSQSQFELEYEDNASANDNVEEPDDSTMEDAHVEQDDGNASRDEQALALPTASTQISTIADSQPTVQRQDHQSASQQAVQYASYIPGSQHQGKTSQDMALLNAPDASNRSRILASQLQTDESAETESDQNKIPSSPPVPVHDSMVSQNSAEASAARRDLLKQFQMQQEESVDELEQREIPESDAVNDDHSRPQTATLQEDSMPLYSTARTHVSGSAQSPDKPSVFESPLKQVNSQRSRLTDQSPALRRFADIAAMPSLSMNSSFDADYSQGDISAVLNNVFTDEDQEVQKLMSDDHMEMPESKRVKRAHTASSSRSASSRPGEQVQPVIGEAGHIAIAQQSTMSDTAGMVPYSALETVTVEPEQSNDEQQPAAPAAIAVSAVSAATISDPRQLNSPPPALRDSPSKANQMPTSLTDDEDEKTREMTAESVRLREQAGRAAVSQLVASRTTGTKSKQTTYGRAGPRKSSRGEARTASKTSKARKLTNGDNGDDAGMAEQIPVVDETSLDDVDIPAESGDLPDTNMPDADDTDEVSPSKFVAHDRVFAFFRGTPHYFYPATWLGASPDGMTYKIRFDDQTVTNIETFHVRRLELRIGDSVKVDETDKRKKNWVVVGFGPVATTDEERALGTDVFGHTHVKVQLKSGRESLAKSTSSTTADAAEVHTVLVNYLYLTTTMWPQYNFRIFDAPSKASASRAATPLSARMGTSSLTETPSRSRRAPAPSAKTKSSRTSHLRETSVASSSATPGAIFTGMAFAISYEKPDAGKQEITDLIKRNGGTILEDGFEELFDLPDISGSSEPTALSKKSPRKKDNVFELQLKPKYRGLKFAALIGDRHGRRAKYMQALALGLPTISGRWIAHSLDEAKNPSSDQIGPLPWEAYLLPAGESIFLGATRSRTISTYDAATASLELTIESRARLLNNEGLILVAPKTGTVNWEKRKTFAFLTMACGAGEIKRVEDVHEAKTLTLDDTDTWKWVYVDSSICETEKVLFGKGAAAVPGKKRKRGGEAAAAVVDEKMSATDGVVKIVNNEFVVQSLILQALVE